MKISFFILEKKTFNFNEHTPFNKKNIMKAS